MAKRVSDIPDRQLADFSRLTVARFMEKDVQIGHLQTKADVQARLATVAARREQMKVLVSEGKSLPEIKQALGEPDPPAGAPGPNFSSYTTVVYNELSKKN